MNTQPFSQTDQTSDIALISSKEFLQVQVTIECRLALTRLRDTIRTYSQFEAKLKKSKRTRNADLAYVEQRAIENNKKNKINRKTWFKFFHW